MPGTSVTAKLHAKMAAKKSHSFIEFLCTNELDSTPKVEPSVTLPIRQAFTFFYRIGLSPSRLRFDTKSGTYLRIKGSKLNQVLCLTLMVATAIRLPALVSSQPPQQSEQGSNSKVLKADVILNMILACAIVAYMVCFYWTLYSKKFDTVVEILNEIVKVSETIYHGTAPVKPSKLKAQMMSSGIIGVCILMGLIGTLDVLLGNGNIHKSMLEVLNDSADAEARAALMLFGHGNLTELHEYKFSAFAPMTVTVLVAAISVAWNFWAQFIWSFGFCALIAVAVSLWLLLALLNDRIKREHDKGLVKEIRTFSKVVTIIEKINGIYGLVNLFWVLAGVLHFSADLFTVFKAESDIFDRITSLTDLVWFGLELWATAQVYEEAMKVGMSLRIRFEEEQSLGVRLTTGDRSEGTEMLLLLHQELNAQNVGLKGHGFFTCSYGFIGTVLGMISTYSVIVIQSQM